MQSKLFRRVAAPILVSFFAVVACAEPAEENAKASEVNLVAAAETGDTTTAASSTDAGRTDPAKPPGRVDTKVGVRALPPTQAEKTEEYKPQTGQEGKDVVWVPTPQPLVNKMLDMANLTPNDVLVDLGSGDGRTVITAAKRGASSTGVEFNPKMVALSRRLAQQEGVPDKAKFVEGDFFKTDFSKASVLTLFLMTDLNLKLRPLILDMKPGTRVVSNTFTMGDWKADQTETVSESDGCTGYCTAHFWIVPAKVQGKWNLPDGELSLMQVFQTVSGTLGGNPISNATLRGDRIAFTAGNAQYSGRVSGRTLTGTVKSGSRSTPFTATRVGS